MLKGQWSKISRQSDHLQKIYFNAQNLQKNNPYNFKVNNKAEQEDFRINTEKDTPCEMGLGNVLFKIAVEEYNTAINSFNKIYENC